MQNVSMAVSISGGRKKGFVIGIDEAMEQHLLGGQFDQLAVVITMSLRRPGLATALQHPQAHDILQQSRRSIYTAFVGEVQAQGVGGVIVYLELTIKECICLKDFNLKNLKIKIKNNWKSHKKKQKNGMHFQVGKNGILKTLENNIEKEK